MNLIYVLYFYVNYRIATQNMHKMQSIVKMDNTKPIPLVILFCLYRIDLYTLRKWKWPQMEAD